MITVLLATRNGGTLLPQVLEGFERLQAPPGGWKLVVVDNGSTDDTKKVLHAFIDRLPLTYLCEEKPGKNAALNAGLGHVEGDPIVFTDDDVFPQSDWLVRIKAAADAHPECSMFGGRVVPRWAAPVPSWMEWVPLGPVYTITADSMTEGPVTASGQIYGPNMAVRRKVFDGGVRFDTTIGPAGPQYAMGSETELVQRLLLQGHLAWYVPDAVVAHYIREFQMRKDWVLKRAIRFGRGRYRLAQATAQAPSRLWFGMPPWLLRKTFEAAWKAAKGILSFDDRTSFSARWDFRYMLGQLTEARTLHRNR